MSRRLLSRLSINQMLFLSHLVLVMSIILGMTYSRYHSEWELRVEQAASIAKSHFTSQLTYLSTSVAGRNYANLMMPTTRETIWQIEDLIFMEIFGVSDYQNIKIGVRYLKPQLKAWRTQVTEQEVIRLREKYDQLVKMKELTPKENAVRHKKYDYLINKNKNDLDALSESIDLNSSIELLWTQPNWQTHDFVLDEASRTLHIHIELSNVNGGSIWAVFNAEDLQSMKIQLLSELFVEAVVALIISIVLIYGVTFWIVAPLKTLSVSMKQDIETIEIHALPETHRNDEIGELARSYSGLIRKIKNQLKVLEKLSDTDPLTGLGSRHKYNRTAEPFVANAMEAGEPVIVLLCDIDNFKAYNDTYGHTEGDNTLCAVAEAINSTIGNKGYVFRFGGEEFVVLAKSTHVTDLVQLAHRVNQYIEKLSIPHAGNPGFQVVTISVGADILSPAAFDQPDYSALLRNALKTADQRSYISKKNGRNRVQIGEYLEKVS